MRIVLQDQLLQPQERPLVRDLLSDLYARLPSVLRCQLGTTWALTGVDDQSQDERLLKDSVCQDLLLDRHFHLDSSGMWFSPHEGGVDKADFHQRSRDLLQANGYCVVSELYLISDRVAMKPKSGTHPIALLTPADNAPNSEEATRTSRILGKSSRLILWEYPL